MLEGGIVWWVGGGEKDYALLIGVQEIWACLIGGGVKEIIQSYSYFSKTSVHIPEIMMT